MTEASGRNPSSSRREPVIGSSTDPSSRVLPLFAHVIVKARFSLPMAMDPESLPSALTADTQDGADLHPARTIYAQVAHCGCDLPVQIVQLAAQPVPPERKPAQLREPTDYSIGVRPCCLQRSLPLGGGPRPDHPRRRP